jgi:DNA-binding MarR family transcriptional regulator
MDLLASSWDELVSAALSALAERNVQALAAVDGALHHRYFAQLDSPSDPESRQGFALDIGDVTESEPARAIAGAAGEDDPVRRYLGRWQHLAELAEALSHDVTAEEAAREFLRSREHGDRLVRIVADAGAEGLKQGELAQSLGITPNHLSNLLREFEAHDLIERRKLGKHVYISLGLTGQLVAAEFGGGKPRRVINNRIDKSPGVFGNDMPANGPAPRLAVREAAA